MARITKVTTKTGDAGETGLGDGSRVGKGNLRVAAFGDVDEANSAIGLALALGAAPRDALARIQNELFDLGSDLSRPGSGGPRITEEWVERLEADLSVASEGLAPLQEFILPGGPPPAAALHLARAVVRRTERTFWALPEGDANPVVGRYLNRLSDLLFVLARQNGGEQAPLWNAGASNA